MSKLYISQSLCLQIAGFCLKSSPFRFAVRAVPRTALLLQEVLLASMAESDSAAQGSVQGKNLEELSDRKDRFGT